MKMKKPKKRFVFLVVFVLAVLISVISYVLINGHTYTNKPANIGYGKVAELYGCDVQLTKEGVVKVDRTYIEDDTVCVELSSIKEGETDVIVKIGSTKYVSAQIKVNSFGVIFDTSAMSFNGYIFAEYAIIICLLAFFIVAVVSYAEAYKKAEFSYTMVSYGGVAVFSLALAVYTYYRMPWMNTFRNFINNFTETGFYFVIVASPLIILISIAFAVSNIWLVRYEGFRAVNLLGIAIGVFWICATAFVLIGRATNFINIDYDVNDMIFLGASYFVSFMECIFLSIMVTSFLSTRFSPPHNKDYLIILGCGIRKDGTLTPLLKGRTDAALSFEKAQYEDTGRHAKFVPSGGQGSDEIISESEAIKRYLLEQGVPEERIIKEDKSVNTNQNIAFSRDKIKNDAGTLEGIKAAFATTNYHIFRGYVLSQKHGLDAQGLSAKTKWYFFPNAFLRELAGLVVEKKIELLISAVFIAAMFVFLNIFIHHGFF